MEKVFLRVCLREKSFCLRLPGSRGNGLFSSFPIPNVVICFSYTSRQDIFIIFCAVLFFKINFLFFLPLFPLIPIDNLIEKFFSSSLSLSFF